MTRPVVDLRDTTQLRLVIQHDGTPALQVLRRVRTRPGWYAYEWRTVPTLDLRTAPPGWEVPEG
jgi:hypothetical protein